MGDNAPWRRDDLFNQLVGNLSFRLLNCSISVLKEDLDYRVRSPFSRILLGKANRAEVEQEGRRFVLEPGRAILVPTDTLTTFRTPRGVSFYWLYFRADYLGCIDLFQLVRPARLAVPGGKLTDHFRRLIRVFDNKDFGPRLTELHHLTALLIPFMKGVGPSELNVKFSRIGRLIPAIRYVEDHLKESLTLGQLARSVHLSPVYFSNLFSDLMGMPPMRYVNRRRLLRAREYLLCSDDSVELIARKVGFPDPFYFSRLFTRSEGVPPSRYRNSLRLATDR